MAPVVLGPTAWGLLAEGTYEDWAAFRAAVERHYGLTCKACLRAFFDMKPEADEPTSNFLRRVEDMRARYGVSKDET